MITLVCVSFESRFIAEITLGSVGMNARFIAKTNMLNELNQIKSNPDSDTCYLPLFFTKIVSLLIFLIFMLK